MRRIPLLFALAVAALVLRFVPAWWCGREAHAWYENDPDTQRAMADALVAFETFDQTSLSGHDRFTGEWALVTHQMVALGLAQLCLAHPDWAPRYAPFATLAAGKTLEPVMRDFGTRAWRGEDALASLESDHGHAYLGYAALALGMARRVDPQFPAGLAAQHDALVAAFARRLAASPTALIETYPGEAYPTDVAAVAAAIAVHGQVTGADHREVLRHWIAGVRRVQRDPASGLIRQRMGLDGAAQDAPRGSGTGLAAYFAGFVDRALAEELAGALFRQEASLLGFAGIREYAPGATGDGDVDSGPVVLGVSVAATGFALAPAHAFARRDLFVRLYRTTELFGLGRTRGGHFRFLTGGPIGNALLLAFLTSGPEVAR